MFAQTPLGSPGHPKPPQVRTKRWGRRAAKPPPGGNPQSLLPYRRLGISASRFASGDSLPFFAPQGVRLPITSDKSTQSKEGMIEARAVAFGLRRCFDGQSYATA